MEIVQFETAKLAKEKGFDWKTLQRYQDNEPNPVGSAWYNHNNKEEQKLWNTRLYSAPTQSLLQKWLRDVHTIHININWVSKKVGTGVHWYYTVKGIGRINNNLLEYKDIRLNSFEEALEEGLFEALKLI